MLVILEFSKRLYLSSLKRYRAEIKNLSYLPPNMLLGPIFELSLSASEEGAEGRQKDPKGLQLSTVARKM